MSPMISQKFSFIPDDSKLKELIAPCGMYCGFCGSYLALQNKVPRRRYITTHCSGCRPRNKQCSFLKKRCDLLLNNQINFCNECEEFPCDNLQRIDNNYQTRYHLSYSFIELLKTSQTSSLREALVSQIKDLQCPQCGQVRCIHNNLCYHCDKDILASMKNYYNTK